MRDSGVSCEFALKEDMNVGKQLKLADAAKARYALFIGGDEGRNNQARLKNLADGSEELVDTCELSVLLSELLSSPKSLSPKRT